MTDASFRMTVEDVFAIRGRGTVAVGRVDAGTLKVGDTIYINGPGYSHEAVVSGLEAFAKRLKQAQSGDRVGVLLRDIGRDEVARGDVLAGVLI